MLWQCIPQDTDSSNIVKSKTISTFYTISPAINSFLKQLSGYGRLQLKTPARLVSWSHFCFFLCVQGFKCYLCCRTLFHNLPTAWTKCNFMKKMVNCRVSSPNAPILTLWDDGLVHAITDLLFLFVFFFPLEDSYISSEHNSDLLSDWHV